MEEQDNHRVIILQELLDQRNRKQKELLYYQEKLLELEEKMRYIEKDIMITNTIINIIEQENVIDLQTYLITNKKDD